MNTDSSKRKSPGSKERGAFSLESEDGVSTKRATSSSLKTLPASENIKVVVRVRPQLPREENHPSCVQVVNERTIVATKVYSTMQMSFDTVYGIDASQVDLWQAAKGSVEAVLDGFNSSLFAYGQTGSGKTYTMFGPGNGFDLLEDTIHEGAAMDPDEEGPLGIVPRAISYLFQKEQQNQNITEYRMTCAFLEIYNEKVFDLLQPRKYSKEGELIRTPLEPREDRQRGVYVQDLTQVVVSNPEDIFSLMQEGARQRAVGSTDMNERSSRSHTIFQLIVEQRQFMNDPIDDGSSMRRGKLNFVDLAGSEKWNTFGKQMTEQRTQELMSINQSLSCLGNCIAALSQPGRTHIPFRDSKLTRLLQDSLGGNSKTMFIATISPSELSFDETCNTLKFADRAKRVVLHAKINEVEDEGVVIRRYEREILRLKQLLNVFASGPGTSEELAGQMVALDEENVRLKEAVCRMSSELYRVNEQRMQLMKFAHADVKNSGSSEGSELRRQVEMLRSDHAYLSAKVKKYESADLEYTSRHAEIEEQVEFLRSIEVRREGGQAAIAVQDRLALMEWSVMQQAKELQRTKQLFVRDLQSMQSELQTKSERLASAEEQVQFYARMFPEVAARMQSTPATTHAPRLQRVPAYLNTSNRTRGLAVPISMTDASTSVSVTASSDPILTLNGTDAATPSLSPGGMIRSQSSIPPMHANALFPEVSAMPSSFISSATLNDRTAHNSDTSQALPSHQGHRTEHVEAWSEGKNAVVHDTLVNTSMVPSSIATQSHPAQHDLRGSIPNLPFTHYRSGLTETAHEAGDVVLLRVDEDDTNLRTREIPVPILIEDINIPAHPMPRSGTSSASSSLPEIHVLPPASVSTPASAMAEVSDRISALLSRVAAMRSPARPFQTGHAGAHHTPVMVPVPSVSPVAFDSKSKSPAGRPLPPPATGDSSLSNHRTSTSDHPAAKPTSAAASSGPVPRLHLSPHALNPQFMISPRTTTSATNTGSASDRYRPVPSIPPYLSEASDHISIAKAASTTAADHTPTPTKTVSMSPTHASISSITPHTSPTLRAVSASSSRRNSASSEYRLSDAHSSSVSLRSSSVLTRASFTPDDPSMLPLTTIPKMRESADNGVPQHGSDLHQHTTPDHHSAPHLHQHAYSSKENIKDNSLPHTWLISEESRKPAIPARSTSVSGGKRSGDVSENGGLATGVAVSNIRVPKTTVTTPSRYVPSNSLLSPPRPANILPPRTPKQTHLSPSVHQVSPVSSRIQTLQTSPSVRSVAPRSAISSPSSPRSIKSALSATSSKTVPTVTRSLKQTHGVASPTAIQRVHSLSSTPAQVTHSKASIGAQASKTPQTTIPKKTVSKLPPTLSRATR